MNLPIEVNIEDLASAIVQGVRDYTHNNGGPYADILDLIELIDLEIADTVFTDQLELLVARLQEGSDGKV